MAPAPMIPMRRMVLPSRVAGMVARRAHTRRSRARRSNRVSVRVVEIPGAGEVSESNHPLPSIQRCNKRFRWTRQEDVPFLQIHVTTDGPVSQSDLAVKPATYAVVDAGCLEKGPVSAEP